jgi:dihydropyrimidinase
MSFETIIKNGSIVTATDTYRADIAIANGKVAAVGSDLPVENA